MLGVDVVESRRYELASGGVTVPEEIYQKTLTCRDIIGKCLRGKGHQAKKCANGDAGKSRNEYSEGHRQVRILQGVVKWVDTHMIEVLFFCIT